MRGIIVKLAFVAVLAAVAAQAAAGGGAATCPVPTVSNIHWRWEDMGMSDSLALNVYGSLDPHGGSGILYALNDDPHPEPGSLHWLAYQDYEDTDRQIELLTNLGENIIIGESAEITIYFTSSCGSGTLLKFQVISGKRGKYSPAPETTPAMGTAVCTPYYVIDSRGSGVADHVLSAPGAEFVRQLKAKKGSQAVYAVTNPYPAVGVIPTLNMLRQSLSLSWRGFAAKWQMFAATMNGIGASIHSKWIGAYNASLQEGEANLRDLINSEVAKCSRSTTKILLVGYSQGAQVTANIYQALDPSTRQRIAGVVLFGDPKYNHLAWAADAYPRDNDGILLARGFFPPNSNSKVLSFCHARDPVCQSWGQFFLHGWGAHLNYDKFGEPQLAANYFATG